MRHFLVLMTLSACATAPTEPPPAPAAESEKAPPPPAGPTRTSVKEMARKLSGKCISGGWIARWRSEGHMDVARPKLYIASFEDRSGQAIDPAYMTSETEARFRLGGVFDIVGETGGPHFIGKGKILRLAETGKGGARVSVYTLTLDMVDPASQRTVQSCEATVEGEL